MSLHHVRFSRWLTSALILLGGVNAAADTSSGDGDRATAGRDGRRPPTRGEALLQGGPGEQVVPHVAARRDGTAWLSWYHKPASASTYSLRLQRLDASGRKRLGEGGVNASTIDSDSWVMDYALLAAENGDAILAYGNTQDFTVRLQRFDERGRARWGRGGVVLAVPDMLSYAPNATLLSDGSVVLAWDYETSSESGSALQRISASGAVLWSAPVRIVGSSPDRRPLFPRVLSTGGTDVLVSWIENTFMMAPSDAFVQRFDRRGRAVWPAPVKLNGDDQLPFPHRAEITSDGAGGLYAAWTIVREDSSFAAFAQHVVANGKVEWTPGGEPAATYKGMSHLINTIDVIHGRVVVSWKETDLLQSGAGISVQAFSPAGERLLGDDGLALLDPAGAIGGSVAAVRPSRGGAAVFHAAGEDLIFAETAAVATVALGLPGYWPGDTVLSPVASPKMHPAVSDEVAGGYWLVWGDERTDGSGSDIWGAFWSVPRAPRHGDASTDDAHR